MRSTQKRLFRWILNNASNAYEIFDFAKTPFLHILLKVENTHFTQTRVPQRLGPQLDQLTPPFQSKNSIFKMVQKLDFERF